MSVSPDSIFLQAQKLNSSDVHMQVGSPIMFRINTELHEASNDALSSEMLHGILQTILGDRFQEFVEEKELDVSYSIGNGLRLRVNCHFESNHPGLVARLIPTTVPTIENAKLEWITDMLDRLHEGLLLFTGPTGAGKSTSMAAVISELLQTRNLHVVTLEDPIEFVFDNGEHGLIRQRQLGDDFVSFPEAMKRVLRQDPNVVMVGEMRDLETIAAALTLAETGHLVIGTLHTPNAMQTIDRIVDVFPPYQQPQIRAQLSMSLRMVVSQRLLKKEEGGMIPLREVLINTVAVANIIRENRVQELVSVIQMGGEHGMMTFESDAKRLYKERSISKQTYEEAMGFIKALGDVKKK